MREIDGTTAVAEYLGRDAATLRWWRHVGLGPASFKLGRRVMYRRCDVDDWIAAEYQRTVRGGIPTGGAA